MNTFFLLLILRLLYNNSITQSTLIQSCLMILKLTPHFLLNITDIGYMRKWCCCTHRGIQTGPLSLTGDLSCECDLMGRFLVLLMACLISAIAASTLSLLWPTPPPDTVNENTRAYNHSGDSGQNYS